jgi:uncharacterized protein Usg
MTTTVSRKMRLSRDRSFELQLNGYRLSTMEIVYHMPDHPHLLQTFIWQYFDLAPDFPELHRFLDFWRNNIEGPLHSVRVMSADLVSPGKMRNVSHSFAVH